MPITRKYFKIYDSRNTLQNLLEISSFASSLLRYQNQTFYWYFKWHVSENDTSKLSVTDKKGIFSFIINKTLLSFFIRWKMDTVKLATGK